MISLHGAVTSGLGQGACFMSLPWVRDAVRRLIGFVPYPGTLNVRLDPERLVAWRRVRDGHAITLAPPASQTCGARLFTARIGDVETAIVVPDQTRHDEDLLELIAPVHLRSHLGLGDGDGLTFRVRTGPR